MDLYGMSPSEDANVQKYHYTNDETGNKGEISFKTFQNKLSIEHTKNPDSPG